MLHACFGSCRGSGSATSALLSALQSALLLSAAAPCSVRAASGTDPQIWAAAARTAVKNDE